MIYFRENSSIVDSLGLRVFKDFKLTFCNCSEFKQIVFRWLSNQDNSDIDTAYKIFL